MTSCNNFKKYKTLSLLSVCLSSIRVFLGPITLLVLAKNLSTEELGFYYAFFSLTAMAQLLEVGMSSVLKQYYSHSYAIHDISEKNIKISNYFNFSIYWYLILSILFFILGGGVSYVMFNDYNGIVNWKLPWFFLLFVSCTNLLVLPLNAMLDGTQRQQLLMKANIVSQLMIAISLWLTIYLGLGLYSLGLSQLVGILFFLLSVFIFNKCRFQFIEIHKKNFSFKTVFNELWPLLKKTSIVWFLGYFYWNGFNIISFKYLGAEIAGFVGMSMSIMRAGQNIAISILNSQMTLYASNIAMGKIDEARRVFKKYFIISFLLLISGYSIFYIFYYVKPDFFLFKKVLPLEQMIYVSIFFALTFIISGTETFIRCFKVEKFVITQTINSILTPFLFVLGLNFHYQYFCLPIISVLIVSILTLYISRRFYTGYSNAKNT
ncbi:TPA: O81 family O-antigen flippase [Escherichia coli]